MAPLNITLQGSLLRDNRINTSPPTGFDEQEITAKQDDKPPQATQCGQYQGICNSSSIRKEVGSRGQSLMKMPSLSNILNKTGTQGLDFEETRASSTTQPSDTDISPASSTSTPKLSATGLPRYPDSSVRLLHPLNGQSSATSFGNFNHGAQGLSPDDGSNLPRPPQYGGPRSSHASTGCTPPGSRLTSQSIERHQGTLSENKAQDKQQSFIILCGNGGPRRLDSKERKRRNAIASTKYRTNKKYRQEKERQELQHLRFMRQTISELLIQNNYPEPHHGDEYACLRDVFDKLASIIGLEESNPEPIQSDSTSTETGGLMATPRMPLSTQGRGRVTEVRSERPSGG